MADEGGGSDELEIRVKLLTRFFPIDWARTQAMTGTMSSLLGAAPEATLAHLSKTGDARLAVSIAPHIERIDVFHSASQAETCCCVESRGVECRVAGLAFAFAVLFALFSRLCASVPHCMMLLATGCSESDRPLALSLSSSPPRPHLA